MQISSPDNSEAEKMAKNRMSDLNNHLFAQLERLSDESLKGEELSSEIARAGAVVNVAEQIIACGSLVLRAKIAKESNLPGSMPLPKILE